jgi:hypothetical protein
LAAHSLEACLLGAQSRCCDFLDSLGIDHDEDGTVENLPDSPQKEKLGQVSTGVNASRPPSISTLSTIWIARRVALLGEVLSDDERLRLGSQ